MCMNAKDGSRRVITQIDHLSCASAQNVRWTNGDGMTNKQTLFVKVSEMSGADMPSQNPYPQKLTGGGVLEFSLC